MLSNPFWFIQYTGYVSFFLELFVIQFLFMRKFPHRAFFALRLLGGLALSVLFVFLPKLSVGVVDIDYNIVLVYVVVFSLFCFRANILSGIFYGLTCWAVQHLAWNLYLIFCMSVAMPNVLTMIVYFLCYLSVYTIVFFAFSFRRTDYVIDREKSETIVVSALILFLTTILYDLATIYDKNTVWYSIYAIFSCVFVLFTQFGISSKNELMRQREQLQIEKSVLESLLYRQTKQQELTRETIEIINRKCHDLKHQINLLREMKQADSDRYLSEMEKTVMVYGDIAKTGNQALDITLTEKCLLCEEHNIKFTYMVDSQGLDLMKAVDISSLFGNMLDNAIECVDVEEEERRIIRLHVSVVRNYLRIHCENYCGHAIRFEEGLPVSDRSHTGYHGFGTKSIRYIAEKYGGTVVMAQEDDFFNVNILLPMAQKSD